MVHRASNPCETINNLWLQTFDWLDMKIALRNSIECVREAVAWCHRSRIGHRHIDKLPLELWNGATQISRPIWLIFSVWTWQKKSRLRLLQGISRIIAAQGWHFITSVSDRRDWFPLQLWRLIDRPKSLYKMFQHVGICLIHYFYGTQKAGSSKYHQAQPCSSRASNLHHLPTIVRTSIVWPDHGRLSSPNRTLPFSKETCCLHGSYSVSLSPMWSPESMVPFSPPFRSSAKTSFAPALSAASTAMATLRDKPCAENTVEDECRAIRPKINSIGLRETRPCNLDDFSRVSMVSWYVARYALRCPRVGVKARRMVLVVARRWMVGASNGCSDSGLSLWRSVWRSCKKVSRVAQITSVIGALWTLRMELMNSTNLGNVVATGWGISGVNVVIGQFISLRRKNTHVVIQ